LEQGGFETRPLPTASSPIEAICPEEKQAASSTDDYFRAALTAAAGVLIE
jgi:hypothetical protein